MSATNDRLSSSLLLSSFFYLLLQCGWNWCAGRWCTSTSSRSVAHARCISRSCTNNTNPRDNMGRCLRYHKTENGRRHDVREAGRILERRRNIPGCGTNDGRRQTPLHSHWRRRSHSSIQLRPRGRGHGQLAPADVFFEAATVEHESFSCASR